MCSVQCPESVQRFHFSLKNCCGRHFFVFLNPSVDARVEVFTGRIFQSRPVPARMATISARPEVKKKISARARPEREIKISTRARPERETEISARARPGPKGKLKFRPEPGPVWNKIKILARAWPGQFFFRFHPRQLGLSDFKTFSCLHIINVFFCCWFIFPQIIKKPI